MAVTIELEPLMAITLHTAMPSDSSSTVLAAFPNAQRIELQVAEGNPSGRSFWMKRGFRVCGQDEARIGDTTLALISMERTVAA